MSRTGSTIGILAVAGALGVGFALTPQPDSLNVYYGLLHAHTMISDGSGSPVEAFKMAEENGLDFFAVTPHNHSDAEDGAKDRRDNLMIATNSSLYDGSADLSVSRWVNADKNTTEQITIKPLIPAANQATSSTFLAIYGQEFSTISSGNHINVLGMDHVITVGSGDFRGLVNLLKSTGGPSPILQFNHPDVQEDLFSNPKDDKARKKLKNDYGIDSGDLGPDFSDMVEALDPYVDLIEVLSGPAMQKKRVNNFKYSSNENDYFFYLKQGFHIGPSVGQDNHYKTWGLVTDARIGVLAESLKKDEIFNAFRKNRTFATEDKNLRGILYIDDHVMGSRIKAIDESELQISVQVTDQDEPHADYTIVIYGGEIESELSTTATNWKLKDGEMETIEVTGNGTYTVKGIFAPEKASFYLAKVTQDDGDRLWTAPIWVNETHLPSEVIAGNQEPEAESSYSWSRSTRSKVYHKKGCSSINRILPENLASGTTPPAGRTLHDCTVAEEVEH